MSGRDLRTFVNNHRCAIGAADYKLVSRIINGQTTGRYKDVNYDNLKAITKLKSVSGEQSLKKVETISDRNKEKKNINFLKQHRKCWKKELVRLKNFYESVVYELNLIKANLPWQDSSVRDFFVGVKEYEDSINKDLMTFSYNSVKPVWDLIEDIHDWLLQAKDKPASDDVSGVLYDVKLQQKEILDQLTVEEKRLEHELDCTRKDYFINEDDYPQLTPGIPEEALFLSCPYDELKSMILNEFKLLDKRYFTHRDYLNVKYADFISNEDVGWASDDHFHFEYILDQYDANMPQRRTLYIDRLMRELPHLSRHDIVNHETWWFSHKSYQSQLTSLYSSWAKDRQDLLLKVKGTFSEAWMEYENEQERLQSRKQQLETCRKLHEKVAEFQEQKREAFRIEQEIAMKILEQESEKMKLEEEKEKQRREKIHAKIKQYQDKKFEEEGKRLEEEKRRLREIEKSLKEQAVRDADRVSYRENELRKRLEEKRLLEQQKIEEEVERENRLEKLREQVSVKVKTDPLRVLQSTEASRCHTKKVNDLQQEVDLQKPLFVLNTFNTNQIISDPRHKVELALRQAGLHNSDYARQVMANVKPLHPSRPDQHSTVFEK